MTQSDKMLKMRGIPGIQTEFYTMQGYLTTTDATTTTVLSIPVAEKTALLLNVSCIGTRDDLTDSLVMYEQDGWRRASGGNVAAFGSANRFESHDSAGAPTVIIQADTVAQAIDVDATGIAAQNWYWFVTVEVTQIILP